MVAEDAVPLVVDGVVAVEAVEARLVVPRAARR